MFSERWGRIGATLVFVGFNLTFFVQFIAGAKGMPRRYASYPAKYGVYHRVSTFGSYLLGVGLVIVAGNWIHATRRGRRAAANVWGASSLDWQTASPPPHDNFPRNPVPIEEYLLTMAGQKPPPDEIPPLVDDPYNLESWRYDPAIDGWVRSIEDIESVQGTAATAEHS